MIASPSSRIPERIQLSIPHQTGREMEFIAKAFKSNWLSTVGPNITALEEAFEALLGVPCVALGSGTAGVHLGIKLLQVKPGAEVVTPSLTFVASANPILYERAVPVFIDSERKTWNVDPERLAGFLKARARVNRLPSAVIVVHLFGLSADMGPILEMCGAFGVPVLEDAAHALGALYNGRAVGTLGDVGAFSMGGNKVVSATAGGILVSRHQNWVMRARHWSTQARDPDPLGLNGYYHSEVGYNYRLSNVLAGIALAQLAELESRVAARRGVFERYEEAFVAVSGIEPQPDPWCEVGEQPPRSGQKDPKQAAGRNRHTRWLSCFLIDDRGFGMTAADLIRFLDAANVESRPVWRPMHTQPLYRGYECVGGEVAEDLNRRGICLPSSSCLSLEDQQFVIDRVIEAHEQAKGRRS